MREISWTEINQIFLPYRGGVLYSIRAPLFFYLQRSGGTTVSRFKHWLYPAGLLARGLQCGWPTIPDARAEVLLVCDYAAEAGFGTLRPLLKSLPMKLTLLTTAPVIRRYKSELDLLPNVTTIDADSLALRQSIARGKHLSRSVRADCETFFAGLPSADGREFESVRWTIRWMLWRAHAYASCVREILGCGIRGVVLHNDFSHLSNVACMEAQRQGIPEATLQHGLPTQEYFPITSRNYLVWGSSFAERFRSSDTYRAVKITGAPRLDSSASVAGGIQGSPLRILFLSQTHSALLRREEHIAVLEMLETIGRHPNVRLRVRLHPQEGPQLFGKVRGLGASATFSQRDVSLADDLTDADAVLSTGSTAALEAMLAQRPVYSLLPPGVANPSGIRTSRTFDNCASALAELLSIGANTNAYKQVLVEQDRILKQYVSFPGEGTTRTCDALGSLFNPAPIQSAEIIPKGN